MRRVGVLMHRTADEPEAQARIAAFLQGLQEAGWAVGRNVRIDTRWSTGDAARLRTDADDLVALGPDVILAGVGGDHGGPAAGNRTVPIVFAQSVDPVGTGLCREPGAAGRQYHRLYPVRIQPERQMARAAQGDRAGSRRAAVLREPGTAGIGQWAVIQAVAPTLGVELSADRPARRRRYRARHFGVRAQPEWRPDRGGERVGRRSIAS